MNVAQLHPARTDPVTGVTWYRPVFDGKSPPVMWGWTADPAQAHPSYADEATLCQIPAGAAAGDRAAILEFSQELQATLEFSRELQARTPQREELPMATAITDDGEVDAEPPGRYTTYMRYPLPPPVPREEVQFDGWQRYRLPSPTTGKLTGFTRATTAAKTTSDHSGLEAWKIRTKVMAVLKAAEAQGTVIAHHAGDGREPTPDELWLAEAYGEFEAAVAEGKAKAINKAIDHIDSIAGGADARELGEAVHDWLGALDLGQVLLHQIPEMFQPYAVAYQDCLRRAGLVAVGEYVERLVYNSRGEESFVGRLDRIYRVVSTGQLVLGDLKTSESLDLSVLEYGIQFGIYGWAQLMLNLDGVSWDEMPKLMGIPHRTDHHEECPSSNVDLWPGMSCEDCGAEADPNEPFCVCVHIPRSQPERSQVVPYHLTESAVNMVTATTVREERRSAAKRYFGQTTPIPTKEALRWVEARQALQAMSDPAQAVDIMSAFEDVWDDELNEFGARCFELLTNTNE